jgi:hypothetical protein
MTFELQIDEQRGQHRKEDASYQLFALFMMSDEEKNDLEYLFLSSFALYITQTIPE